MADWLGTSKHRLAFVTLGQSPRIDLVPEILEELAMDIEHIEFGLLDEFDDEDLAKVRPVDGEPAFISRLRDGRHIELSVDWTYDRFDYVYNQVISNGADLVVLMSTGSGSDDFIPQSPILLSDRVVDRAMESLVLAELNVGLIVPLGSMPEDLSIVGGPWPGVVAEVAMHGDHEALSTAGQALKDCDLIVLHSMGYSPSDHASVHAASGRPVIRSRRIIANAIKTALTKLGDPADESAEPALSNRLRTLTDREREIMFLVATGQSNKEIGRDLGISFRTVEIHRARMMEKMAFRSLSELVRVVDMVSDF